MDKWRGCGEDDVSKLHETAESEVRRSIIKLEYDAVSSLFRLISISMDNNRRT